MENLPVINCIDNDQFICQIPIKISFAWLIVGLLTSGVYPGFTKLGGHQTGQVTRHF